MNTHLQEQYNIAPAYYVAVASEFRYLLGGTRRAPDALEFAFAVTPLYGAPFTDEPSHIEKALVRHLATHQKG